MATFSSSTFFLLVVSLSCFSLTVTATSYQDCGSKGEVIEVLVTDCDVPPCIVYRPNNYSIGITFVAPKDATTLNTEIIATVSGSVEVPWPAPSACGLLGDLSCPILQGQTYPFLMTMQVLPEYPQPPYYRWLLSSDKGRWKQRVSRGTGPICSKTSACVKGVFRHRSR